MKRDDFLWAAQEILCNSPRDTERFSLVIDWEKFSINDCVKKFEEASRCNEYHCNWFEILFDTLREKSTDYSPANDAFANFKLCSTFWISVEDWIKVRLCDKVSRVRNLRRWVQPAVENEPLADTYLDIAWYLTILYIYTYRNEWESE